MQFKPNETRMIRNSKTPTLLLVGLVIVIMIITYNYWILLEKNSLLKESLILNEEKLNDLNEKKAWLESQNSIAADKSKSFSEKIESNLKALSKKDSEIDELNSNLKSKIQELDAKIIEINDLTEKLTVCKTDENKAIDYKLKYEAFNTENSDLKLKITDLEKKLASQTIEQSLQKDDSITALKNKIIGTLNEKLDKESAKKLLSFMFSNENLNIPTESVSKIDGNQKFQNLTQKLEIKSLNSSLEVDSLDICKLPKDVGKCDKPIERYFYDNESGNCLLFVYNGCEGNLNNFNTAELCKEKCIKTTTGLLHSESKTALTNQT